MEQAALVYFLISLVMEVARSASLEFSEPYLAFSIEHSSLIRIHRRYHQGDQSPRRWNAHLLLAA